MNENTNIKMELDSHLRQMLNAYGVIPRRNQDFARRNRERFITELNTIFERHPPMPVVGRSGFAPTTFNFKRFILYSLTALSVVAMFLLGGVGMTAYAASLSLPGDTLYSLKMISEKIQANLAIDADTRARLYLGFAGRRLSETRTLIEKGRYTDVTQATSEYEADVQKSLIAVEDLSRVDPSQSIELNAEIDTALREYTVTLGQLIVVAPEYIKPVIQHAIIASQNALDDDDMDDDNDLTPIPTTETPVTTTTPTPYDITTTTPTQDSPPLPSSTPEGSTNNGNSNDDGGNDDGGGGDDDDGNSDDDGDDDDGGGGGSGDDDDDDGDDD
jgi:uncharacterized membrane protein YgcG